MTHDLNALNDAKQLAQEVAERAKYLQVGKLASAVLILCQAMEDVLNSEAPRHSRRASRRLSKDRDGKP